MTPILSCKTPVNGTLPRILLVDDEPALVEVIRDVVSHQMPCRILTAGTRHQALRIVREEPIELLVADVNLPDGDGMSLLEELRRHQPTARAIVITGAPSVDGAITALRGGAVDFVPKPFAADTLAAHVRGALERQAKQVKEEKRLDRLRDAVKRLNAARKLVSRKVDLLCNDLIAAYGDLARQMDAARTQEGFRKYLASATDLEQLLCHAMDWLLRQLGYTNIAIWLAAEETDFQLGAYMKYTINGDQELSEAMSRGCLPTVLREGAVLWDVEQMQEQLTEPELDYLADQTLMGVNCTYLGESLGAVVVFRDAGKPFADEDLAMLKAISPIFSLALATVVRGGQKYDAGDSPFFDGVQGEDAPPKDQRASDADWWKRGEAPPF